MTTRVILATQERLCYDRTRLSRHSSEVSVRKGYPNAKF